MGWSQLRQLSGFAEIGIEVGGQDAVLEHDGQGYQADRRDSCPCRSRRRRGPPKAPPSSLVQLRIAGTHGDARDTRPN